MLKYLRKLHVKQREKSDLLRTWASSLKSIRARKNVGPSIVLMCLNAELPTWSRGQMESSVPRMVGRDRELCQLKDLLHRAVEGNGNVILISGEAGIGKTRLINELEAYAEPLGIRVLARALKPKNRKF